MTEAPIRHPIDELARSLKTSLDAGMPARSLGDAERQLELALELALVAGVRVEELTHSTELQSHIEILKDLLERHGPEAIARYIGGDAA
jgi:hypothetical protein